MVIPANPVRSSIADKATAQTGRQRIAAALVEAGIVEDLSEETPDFTDNSKVVMERRYLSKDRQGTVLEDPDGMFRRVANNLSQADLLYGATEEQRRATEEEFYRLMRSLEVLPNSPTLMNAGRELQQLSACFVLPVEDSLDSIFDKVKQTALIHKSGGGTGFSFSRLRPSGDVVGSTGGIASGPVSFIRAFDTATDVVKQGGTRRGANMGILNVTHPDAVAFIKSKEDGKYLNNFNISVGVTRDFMEKAKVGQDYDLLSPRTGEVVGQANAREVFDLMAEMAWKTGDPGLVFLDVINRDNPNPQLGEIESTNPCGEQPLLPYESCNLASVNLARMVQYDRAAGEAVIDWDRMARSVRTAVHLLDNVIDMNNYPIEEIEEMSKNTRRIGLGVMGFSDLLIQLGIPYDSAEALAVAESVMKHIWQETHAASADLAGRRGPFPAWEGSAYNRPVAESALGSGLMRNSAPTTIAPTGTISIIAGASSGVEPLFALSYVRNVMDNTRLVEGYPYFQAVARREGFYSPELMEELAEKGSLQSTGAPQWVKDVFRTSHDISPEWHVRMQAAFQKYTDNSVSKTINFPHDCTVDDVRRGYMLAYELGCKGITVYRDGSKDGQVLSFAGSQEQPAPAAPATLIPRERPQTTHGVTERVRTGHGNMYVTINFDEEQKPFEVFGALGKAGGCDSAQLEAISRLVSLALRSGIDPSSVLEQLRGITCCPAWDSGTLVRSSPDALALALERHLESHAGTAQGGNAVQLTFTPSPVQTNGKSNGHHPVKRCPECNTPVIFQEGCQSCVSCGWNKCE